MKMRMLTLGLSMVLTASCSDPTSADAPAKARGSTEAAQGENVSSALPAPEIGPIAAVDLQPIRASASPAAAALDSAVWSNAPATPETKRNAMIRSQVLLARAHFSPGVIDGQDGGNVRNAVKAFEEAHSLPVDGVMDAQTWAALAEDAQPTVTDYVITDADVKGPFITKIPTDYVALAKLDAVGFTSPLEALAEKFHMDEALLKALNPDADFAAAGTRIVVAALGASRLAAPVTLIEVDKSRLQVRAYGADHKLLAVYPATVGSAERPAPAGDWAVRTVAPNPTYTYDPSRLTFGKAAQGKLTIKPGPNNPVGGTWIDLTKDTYGIHGTPDPRMVGKVASHGCVRLTNWDVAQLSQAVKAGTEVKFLGAEAA